jgi:cytochrome P450/NADPH-cytochrome P450 reductase
MNPEKLSQLPSTSKSKLRSTGKVAGSPIEALMKVGRELGPVFRVKALIEPTVVVWGHDLVHEVCDDSRFDKKVIGGVARARRIGGDGLFTAHTEEPNWSRAHNILLPSFSPKSMKRYLSGMLTIARHLMAKWEKDAASGAEVEVTHDMTSLTLDTIGLCGFDYSFDSFSSESPHPFIVAMSESLAAGQAAQTDHPLVTLLNSYSKLKKVNADVSTMQNIVEGIIAERKRKGTKDHQDLLQSMLDGVDPQSGSKLDDTNIRNQILIFLIAGHETTSGLLSFALHFLVSNPDILEAAYREVDEVLGGDLSADPTDKQIARLDLIPRILNESLRLWPTAPIFTRAPLEDVVLGGRYAIPKGTPLRVLIPMLHRDERVWPDPERFDPDRFLPENEAKRPPDCFKPFGTGQRACIGRAFALREAILVLAMVLQRFKFRRPSPYQLHLVSTLTIKPADLKLILSPRESSERAPMKRLESSEADGPKLVSGHGTPLTVLYGSNMGTCSDFADRVAQDAGDFGFEVSVGELDNKVGKLPSEGDVIIIVSSYNGAPPDNATGFLQWLREAEEGAANGVSYTVFGCGNKDWSSTYQAIPRELDAQLEKLGATRTYALGEGNAKADLDGDFENWYGGLWQALGGTPEGQDLSTARGPLYEITTLDHEHPNPFAASFQAKPMAVVVNRELQKAHARSTRHIEVALPEGVSYTTGDHLGVLASNELSLVQRVAARFGMEPGSRLILKQVGRGKAGLPTGEIVSLGCLLGDYLELQAPASREAIRVLAEQTPCPADKTRLEAFMADEEAYRSEILVKNRSIFNLLDDCRACQLPLALFLELMPALKPRFYSISSSPRAMGRLCSITVGVVDAESRTGKGRYRGTASNYLASLDRGSEVFAFVHDTKSAFRLPGSTQTPIIMVGAGTGVAPYRGFLQERAHFKQQGDELGQALLFFGFRHSAEDFIYREEFEEYVRSGVAELITAPSREFEKKVYVQDRILEESERVWACLEAGAVIYVCGDASKMAPSVREAFKAVYREHAGSDDSGSEAWVRELENGGRYKADVWATT